MADLIGVDVGGTFTDVVVVGDDGASSRKVPTTDDQSEGVAAAVADIDAGLFLHGTTAATNTLLEGRGARVGLITDPGYEDLIEIARQDRPALYDSSVDRPPPLVAREDRHSDPGDLGDVDIVAISLLDSFADPKGERSIAEGIELPTVLSSVVSPEFREYERLATTVLSAYLTPSVAEYLRRLDSAVDVPRRLVMTSSGGLIPFEDGADFAGRLVLSGPAGGVVAAAAVGAHHGYESVIAFDMGGTSTDVCRITGGEPSIGAGHHVAGHVNRVPSVPVHTIGAGGGSIAWIDDGGALRVGPRSAGANPGPAVYGRGGEQFTVTDANVLAGNIPADLELAGSVALDVEAARQAARRLAARLDITLDAVVNGTLEVVDAHMERALRAVTVEEGADPRQSVMVAFGGAGGLHASRLARRLGMRGVLVPPHSGVFSALGLLLATPRADAVQTVMVEADDSNLDSVVADVEAEVESAFRQMFQANPPETSTSVDVRYPGQAYELSVPFGSWEAIERAFHAVHAERFGFDRQDQPVEVVNVRAVATGVPPMTWRDLPQLDDRQPSESAEGVWLRDTLPAGFSLSGPATVVEDNSATRLEAEDTLEVLADGTLSISFRP